MQTNTNRQSNNIKYKQKYNIFKQTNKTQEKQTQQTNKKTLNKRRIKQNKKTQTIKT